MCLLIGMCAWMRWGVLLTLVRVAGIRASQQR